MLTLKTNNREVVELMNGLFNVQNLEDANPIVVQARKDQLAKLDEMLEDKIEISLHTFTEDVLPVNITAAQLTSIDTLLT